MIEAEQNNQQFPPYMPMPPSKDAHIAALRWEPDEIIQQIYRNIGGYDFVEDADGKIQLTKPAGSLSLVNEVGLKVVVIAVQGIVSPVTSLSNIDEVRGDELYRQTMEALIIDLAVNKEAYGIQEENLPTITTFLKPIVFLQIYRAVGGHETRASTKTGIDITNTSTNNTPPPVSRWPFGFGGKGNG